MANISRNSYNESALYDKVIQQQGTPITDYDFNELQDIQRVKLRRVISELLGDGSVGTGWKVQAQATPSMSVDILAGTIYIGGYRVVNNTTQSLIMPAAPGSGSRTDAIYVHFKEVEIDSTQDPNIKHPSLTMEPTRRTKIQADVAYAQGTTIIPSNTTTDFYSLLATITISAGNTSITNAMITDSRIVKAVFSSSNQTFTGTVTAAGVVVNGSETIQGNQTFQPTGAFSTSQTNSIIHNPIFNSSNATTQVAQIDLIRTSTADGTYDGEVSIKTRSTGGALTEAARFKKDQSVTFNGATTFSGTATFSGNASITGTLGVTGLTTFNGGATIPATKTLTVSGSFAGSAILPISMGGTGSSTQNFVDLTTAQTVAGAKTFSGAATFSAGLTIPAGQTLTNAGTISGGTINATSVPWTGITSKPTTLAGYAITDNVVTSITSGSNITVTNPTGIGAATVGISGIIPIANGGTGSSTQNFVDLSTTQTIGGAKTFTGTHTLNGGATIPAGATVSNAGTITNTGTISGGTIIASTMAWSGLTAKPTTISGYGITDNIVTSITAGSNITVSNPTGAGAATVGITGIIPVANGGTGSSTQNFVDLSTAQTIAGAKTFSGAVTLNAGGSIPAAQTLTNAGTITNTGTITGGTINASTVPWGGISSKPTTLSGYGITDNIVTSITAGSNITITNPTGAGAATVGITGIIPIANGGTGSNTQNFVDLSTTQTVGGAKTFSGNMTTSGLLTASGGLVLESRTTDPASPAAGRIWFRSDL